MTGTQGPAKKIICCFLLITALLPALQFSAHGATGVVVQKGVLELGVHGFIGKPCFLSTPAKARYDI